MRIMGLFKNSLAVVLLAASLVVIAAASTTLAWAGQYDVLYEEFDARALTNHEKGFLQAALAFQGYYKGLIDGKWGRRSQRALEKYTSEKFKSAPMNIHMGSLAFEFVNESKKEGWELTYFEDINVSLLFPSKHMIEKDSEGGFREWEHSDRPFVMFTMRNNSGGMRSLHQWLAERAADDVEPYAVRKSLLWVTSVRANDNTMWYMRSDLIRGSWSTVVLNVGLDHAELLNGVAVSITPGRSLPIDFPETGELARMVSLTASMLKEDSGEPVESETPVHEGAGDSADEHDAGAKSGSGFYVDNRGSVLTNAHVVRGCQRIAVNGDPASIVAVSSKFDLALIRSPVSPDVGAIAQFAPRPAELNADITVIGFPLRGLLGGLNVTRGAVTSTKGVGGTSITMQISAPVQSGNSGGPVVDEAGRVVGVVVAKLNAVKFADLVGEIPQNINFAIRGEIAKVFLSSNGIEFSVRSSDKPVLPTHLAKNASEYTVLVECE